VFEKEIEKQQEYFRKLEAVGIGKAQVWYGGAHKWGIRTPYDAEHRLVQAYIIFPEEVIFDVDANSKEKNKEMITAIRTVLEQDKIPYLLIDTGGRGYHVHVFLKRASFRYQFFHLTVAKACILCPELKVDENLLRDVHLVRAPYGYHEKTNKQCLLLNPDFSPMQDIPEIKIYKPVFKEFKKASKDEACFGEIANLVFQQINGNKFVTWDGSAFRITDTALINGRAVKPLKGEEVDKGFILLADEPEEYGSVHDLISEIREFSSRYVDIPDDFRTFASYYVLLTWIYDKGNTIPYLRFMGDTGVGKSRALDVFSQLCYNYIPVNGAANSAPIYRIIEKWRGTLGFEEGDFKKSDETSELIKVINCGWERGRPIIRCEKNKPDKINFFDPYCPKAFATRKQFDDAATEGRCLTNIMQETIRHDIPSVLPASFYEEAKSIRNKLLCFRLKNYKKINPDNILPLPFTLEPRLRQLATPLSMVFSENNEDWEMFVVFLLEYQKQLKETRLNSETGVILSQLLELAEDGRNVVIYQDIADALHIPRQRVTKELKLFGFFTQKIRLEIGEGKKKDFRALRINESDWQRLVRRYLPEPIPRPFLLSPTSPASPDQLPDAELGTSKTSGTLKPLLENGGEQL